jgi:molybdate transport system substrate-binding protein
MKSLAHISGSALIYLFMAWQPDSLPAEELPVEELIVSAAVSLTNAFTELGSAYERDNPGKSIILNFGGSGQLLQQIDRGAPVDVFASADQETMSRAQKRNLIVRDSRVDFARNTLVLIAPADSKLEMTDLGQLRAGTVSRIAISNPASVPVGRYSRLALETAGLWKVLAPRFINTQHVRQSLDYVARGEVDVGFVYATDARVRPDRVRVVMEVSTSIPITYPIAVVADTRESDLARHFIAFVKSSRGLAILEKRGFAAP